MRVLIDTCVLIDAMQRREPFWRDAANLLYAAAAFQFEAFTTAKALADIHYLMRRALHDERGARQAVGRLLRVVDVLDTLAVDCTGALGSKMSDFEDAVMVQSALRSGMDCLVTRNLKDYGLSPIPVLSPLELLTRI